MSSPIQNVGRPAVKVFVATTVMLTFISFWRASAIVLADLASSAYYAGGDAEKVIGKSAALLRRVATAAPRAFNGSPSCCDVRVPPFLKCESIMCVNPDVAACSNSGRRFEDALAAPSDERIGTNRLHLQVLTTVPAQPHSRALSIARSALVTTVPGRT